MNRASQTTLALIVLALWTIAIDGADSIQKWVLGVGALMAFAIWVYSNSRYQESIRFGVASGLVVTGGSSTVLVVGLFGTTANKDTVLGAMLLVLIISAGIGTVSGLLGWHLHRAGRI